MEFMNMFMLGLHCSQLTEGDITKRLCTAEEVKFFLNSLLGKSSSWTKRPVEVDSPKPVSQWDQIAECPDSTCAQVVHSNAEICGIVPLAAKECPEQKEQLGKGKVP
ncbi:hypothetical protein GLYMA_13G096925v4 [Glycine max]|nr:hypothetical protein GLYMA_13G096925v4 [Glycine max]KAH1100636.1 hypothetical protein GYH30_035672 [Glycine max]